jgi:hypothetical protein
MRGAATVVEHTSYSTHETKRPKTESDMKRKICQNWYADKYEQVPYRFCPGQKEEGAK